MPSPCDTCGNVYDKAFTIQIAGRTLTFDSFECAIHACAPRCEHCNCPIIGHGVQKDEQIFCCSHCASAAGVDAFVDRV